MYFIIQALTLCIHVLDKCGNSLKLLLCPLQLTLLLGFLCFQMKLSLTDSRFTDIDLLHHGIETLGFSLGSGTGIEKLDNLVLAILHCLGALFDLCLNIGNPVLFCLLALPCFQKSCMELGFLRLLPLQRLLAFLQIRLNGLQTALVMFFTLHSGQNLFPKYLGLAIQLLPADCLILRLFTQLIHLGIQLFQFLFQTIIFHFRLLVGLLILLQLLSSPGILGIQLF